jgi:hypothetical protein
VLPQVGQELDKLLARDGADVDHADPPANVGLDDEDHAALLVPELRSHTHIGVRRQ